MVSFLAAELVSRYVPAWTERGKLRWQGKVDCVYSQVKQRSRVRVLEDKLGSYSRPGMV